MEWNNDFSGNGEGELDWNLTDGMLAINDTHMAEAVDQIKEKVGHGKEMTGICIGSGGMLSLLPEFRFNSFVMVDKNAAVINFNKLLDRLISSDVEDPLGHLLTILAKRGESEDTMINELREENMLSLVKFLLEEEADSLGKYHWSRRERRQVTRDALRRTPVDYIWADIAAKQFGRSLAEVFAKADQKIDFLNMTNVHIWIDGGMSFLKSWPIAAEPIILFSSHRNVGLGSYPKVEIAFSLDQYLEKTGDGKTV